MSDITKIKVDGEPESSYKLFPKNREFEKRAGGNTDSHSGVQPDWNQNDATKPDYVKNRPFWREKTKELLFPLIPKPIEVTTEDNGSGFFTANGEFSVAQNVTNYVVFDGVEYACEPYYEETAGMVGIGSLDFSDYPFFIANNIISTQTPGNHTVRQYFASYAVHADYVPNLVIFTKQTEDGNPYLEMADVEKIKDAFKKSVPITLHTVYRNNLFIMRVNNATDSSIFASGFRRSYYDYIMIQASFEFSVSDGIAHNYGVSYSGSIVENGDTYPLMYINGKRYKITVDGSGALTATEVT